MSRPRSTKQLSSLSDKTFWREIAEGMRLVAEHVATLTQDAERLAEEKRLRGASILRAFADEEAAKFLILLDAVRCPKRAQKERAQQLARFHDHLAKGLYVKAAEIRPADFRELLGYLKLYRKSHYLDGPNDVDWIFRNEVFSHREEVLYVDYVESDDGAQWISPESWEIVGDRGSSSAVAIVGALNSAGAATEKGLSIIADIWREFIATDDTRWTEVRKRNVKTLEAFDDGGLVAGELGPDEVARVVSAWTFPLHMADLSPIDVDLESLRERQRNWSGWDY